MTGADWQAFRHWREGPVDLLLGDAGRVLAAMPDDKVDTVVTMGTPAQSPVTTTVPSQTRLLNFVGIADPLVSLRLHPRGTNYLIFATHTARSYTENDAVLALVRRAIAR